MASVLTIWHPSFCIAGRTHPEAYYQKDWCLAQEGVLEFVVPSGARCDCLTTTHAVEFDFADNWAEAIGQSLHYANQTNRRAGVVLIIESPNARIHLRRLLDTIHAHELNIDVWTTGVMK